MKLFSKLADKLFLKQWSIGISESSIENIIKNKEIKYFFKWIPVNNNYQFFADPFIFKSLSGKYCILYEELDYKKQYGYICQFTLNNEFDVISKKVLLETKSHLSYPFIFYENNEMYVFPESSASGKLSCYQYDYKTQSLSFVKDIIDLPLLDSTILKHHDIYWIFCTIRGTGSNNKLSLFYSKNLFGPYLPHKKNPVKIDIKSSRPAGKIIEIDGILYRPTQNSGNYYGGSINLNRIFELDENNFREEHYMSITTDKKSEFNFGLHTINYADDLIVIDGLKRVFVPHIQLVTFIRKNFQRIFSKK